MPRALLIFIKGQILAWSFSLFIGCSNKLPSHSSPTIKQERSISLNIINRLHITSDDGQQGIATDGEFIFIQNSQQLFKYNSVGKLLVSGPKLKLHHGGITYHRGRFYVAESFFDNDHKYRVIEFDTSFRHIKDHEIDFKSPFGIQGLEYIPQKKSFQVHSHAEIFYQINDRFEKESMVIGRASFELQDLALLNKNTIIINNRDAQTIEFAEIK